MIPDFKRLRPFFAVVLLTILIAYASEENVRVKRENVFLKNLHVDDSLDSHDYKIIEALATRYPLGAAELGIEGFVDIG